MTTDRVKSKAQLLNWAKSAPRVLVTVEGLPAGISSAWLIRKLRHVLNLLHVENGDWTIKVAPDREMSALHHRSLGIAETTDVLTFDLREIPSSRRGEGQPLELDTIICLDEARRRSRELGHDVRKELLLYCVHSLLHVQGYDDVTPRGARKMHLREDQLLVAAGVGAVYAGGMSSKDNTRRTKQSPRRAGRDTLKSGRRL